MAKETPLHVLQVQDIRVWFESRMISGLFCEMQPTGCHHMQVPLCLQMNGEFNIHITWIY